MFGVTREQLAAVHPFEGLDDETLDAILGRALFIWVPAGQTVVQEGTSGFDFYVILAGDADVESGGRVVAHLGPGDVFGEMALVDGARRNANVEAASALTLMTMSAWNYRATTTEFPAVAVRLEQLAESRRSPSV